MADAFNPAGSADASATETIHPRQWMTPGWYWAFLDPREAGQLWTAFTRNNPAVRTEKTVGTGGDVPATEKGAWVLFQVRGTSPVLWTLPGLPSKALKGAATEYSDVVAIDTTPDAADSLSDFLGGFGKQLGTATTVLVWGAVAVLLWQLFQKTGGTTSQRRPA